MPKTQGYTTKSIPPGVYPPGVPYSYEISQQVGDEGADMSSRTARWVLLISPQTKIL